LLLVRLENIDAEELDELLQESYRISGAPGKPKPN